MLDATPSSRPSLASIARVPILPAPGCFLSAADTTSIGLGRSPPLIPFGLRASIARTRPLLHWPFLCRARPPASCPVCANSPPPPLRYLTFMHPLRRPLSRPTLPAAPCAIFLPPPCAIRPSRIHCPYRTLYPLRLAALSTLVPLFDLRVSIRVSIAHMPIPLAILALLALLALGPLPFATIDLLASIARTGHIFH
ncbi:hypothetical protein BJ912DRAFT_1063556 [Pholiota molesta]|nr:hypothetical protein BJ912DRAFT_1063556 [Pholiota molesta]